MSFNPEAWTKNWYATADAEHRIEFRNWLRGILLNERMNISFIKADGSLRHLHCSLHHELAPAVYDNLKEDQSEDAQLARKPNLETLAVWDLEAKAWRSFRLDSIQDFSYNLGDLHTDNVGEDNWDIVDLWPVNEFQMWLPRHDGLAELMRSKDSITKQPGIIWDKVIVDVIKERLTPDSVVLDLGACFGQMSFEFSKLCSKVHAFEAHPFQYDLICRNISQNNITNVEVHHAAVWDSDGLTLIYPKPKFHLYPSRACWGIDPKATGLVDEGDVEVKSMTIDSLNLPRVDIVKIDVQGADLKAMQGMVDTIRRCRPIILFEYEPCYCAENEAKLDAPLFDDSFEDYKKFIDEIGYKITLELPNHNYMIEPA